MPQPAAAPARVTSRASNAGCLEWLLRDLQALAEGPSERAALRKQQQHAPPTQPGALRAAGRRRHAPACVDGLCQCRRVSKELRREDAASNRVVSALVVGCIARRCLSQRHFTRARRCELLRRVRLSRTCPARFNSYMSCGLLAAAPPPAPAPACCGCARPPTPRSCCSACRCSARQLCLCQPPAAAAAAPKFLLL